MRWTKCFSRDFMHKESMKQDTDESRWTRFKFVLFIWGQITSKWLKPVLCASTIFSTVKQLWLLQSPKCKVHSLNMFRSIIWLSTHMSCWVTFERQIEEKLVWLSVYLHGSSKAPLATIFSRCCNVTSQLPALHSHSRSHLHLGRAPQHAATGGGGEEPRSGSAWHFPSQFSELTF